MWSHTDLFSSSRLQQWLTAVHDSAAEMDLTDMLEMQLIDIEGSSYLVSWPKWQVWEDYQL